MTAPETNKPVPSDAQSSTDAEKRAGWTTYLIVAVLLSMYFFQTGAVGPYKHEIAASLGVPLSHIVFSVTLGYALGALFLIPGALVLQKFGVRRLAWPCALLTGTGSLLMAVGQTTFGIYASVTLITIAVCILMPMAGFVARTRIDPRIFIMVSTITLVTIRFFEVISLTLAGLLLEIVHWRVFYGSMGLLFLPLAIYAWLKVTDGPVVDQVEDSRLSSGIFSLFRSRVVLFSGVALAFAMAPTTAFGFIWDVDLQAAFGWEEPMKSVLTATFVIGVITGGLAAGVVAHWIGAYITTICGLALGALLFAILLFQDNESHSVLRAMPLMFFCGFGLGVTALIAPYATKCVAPQYAGMVFSITNTIKSLFSGVLVGVPLWFLPTGKTWTLDQEQEALVPYLFVLIIAIVAFMFARAKSYE